MVEAVVVRHMWLSVVVVVVKLSVQRLSWSSTGVGRHVVRRHVVRRCRFVFLIDFFLSVVN